MVYCTCQENNDVSQVQKGKLPAYTDEYDVHHSLEIRTGSLQPIRNFYKPVQAMMGRKCWYVLIAIFTFNLLVRRSIFLYGKHCRLSWTFYAIVNAREVVQVADLGRTKREPFLSALSTICVAYLVVLGSITFSAIIRFISAAANCLATGPANYQLEGTKLTLLLVSLFWCFETYIRLRCPSHMLSNSVGTSIEPYGATRIWLVAVSTRPSPF